MKLNKKMLNIPIVLMVIVGVLYALNIPARIDILNGISRTDKIGIIPISYSEEEQKYENKEEVIVTDKQILYKIINTINNGKIDTDVKLDRLPADYQLIFYKKDQQIKAYYWIDSNRYNLNIEGVQGEISVDKKIGEIIETIIK